MSEVFINNSKEAVVERSDIKRNRFGKKYRDRYQIYLEIENGKSMWNEKSIMYKKVEEFV